MDSAKDGQSTSTLCSVAERPEWSAQTQDHSFNLVNRWIVHSRSTVDSYTEANLNREFRSPDASSPVYPSITRRGMIGADKPKEQAGYPWTGLVSSRD
jgi:hypothetical protein